MFKVSPTIVASLLFLFAGIAQGAPLTWTIQNAQFEDGSPLTGSFDYDATTNTYSNISITSGPFGNFGETYTDDPFFVVSGDATQLQISKFIEPLDLLFLSFGEALTDAGGAVPLAGVVPYEQINFFGIEQRFLAVGWVTAPAVPVPAAVWLFGSALGFLGWLKRRSTR